jgi:HSP20 family molecular chaperone IbpA
MNPENAMSELTAVQTPAQAPATAAGPSSDRDAPALLPPVDVIEDSTGITLYTDLPGVPRDALHLRVDGDQLHIEAETRLNLPEGMTPTHVEVGLSRFRRAFTLSKELDADKVAAELSQGVLRVRIPKAAHAQPRRISVQVG